MRCENSFLIAELTGRATSFWRIIERRSGTVVEIGSPVMEIDGAVTVLALDAVREVAPPHRLNNGGTEYAFGGPVTGQNGLSMRARVRMHPDSPVLRFAYSVESTRPRRMTKAAGRDEITYLSVSCDPKSALTEVSLSEFNELTYAYEIMEKPVDDRHFRNRLSIMGPILVEERERASILLAYEHGSMSPETYLAYRLGPGRTAELRAVKGNYYADRVIDAGHPYETVWFQFAVVPGGKTELAKAYRTFIHRHFADRAATRVPYISYNTWGFQERDQFWNKCSCLDALNYERMFREIDIAHRMGVDIFVIDVGWFDKSGDWTPSEIRFPQGIEPIRKRLDERGMKLGLWFCPTASAVSSTLTADFRDCLAAKGGKPYDTTPLWGTETSHLMCLASRYADGYADAMIRCAKELGVTYFKFDGVSMHLCDAAGHGHGTEENSPLERAECHSFEVVRSLARIAERVAEAVPGAIIDLDLTEPDRCMGLSVLSAGRIHHINHGRFANYFMPVTREEWTRDYVHLHASMLRGPIRYDAWIPSFLFLGHHLPEGSTDAQLVNLASLILGPNGIWGDLLEAPEECVRLFGEVVGRYKQIREDIAEAYPVMTGSIGSTTEIYEKIAGSGRGAVVLFSSKPGTQTYVTLNPADPEVWTTDGVEVKADSEGRAVITASFGDRGAKIVFFGVG